MAVVASFNETQPGMKSNRDEAMEIPDDVAAFALLGYVLYFLLIVLGIPANCFVLLRMIHFKSRCPDTYRMGTGACLLAMSVADIVALLAIFALCIVSFGIPLPFSSHSYDVICKISIFSMHSATSVAIWSWLLMSILRWLALYRPLLHHTLYNLPVRALGLVCIIAVLSNAWLPITVYYDGKGCNHSWLLDSEAVTRCLLLLEMTWSFIIPIAVVAYLDLSTLFTIPRLISARNRDTLLHCERTNDSSMKKSSKTLLRWLAIAVIDILLNAPENIRRLARILDLLDDETVESHGFMMWHTVSDIFYYSQYSFNAAYLALFIYDRATSSAPSRREHSSCRPIMHSLTLGDSSSPHHPPIRPQHSHHNLLVSSPRVPPRPSSRRASAIA